MIRTLLIGATLFVLFAVVFAPASLIRQAVPEDAGVELLAPTGTLWRGSAELYLGGQPAGRAAWEFRPATMLQGALGYDVRLNGPEHDLSGTVAAAPGSASVSLGGTAAAGFVNRWLAPYDIVISGALALEGLEVRIPYETPASGAAAGTLSWEGGPVQYRLSGRSHASNLPPLVGYLGKGLEGVVYPQGGQTPLLRAQILPNGFARIAITQLFTELAGNPWPGSHQEHEVVLEVEEQVF